LNSSCTASLAVFNLLLKLEVFHTQEIMGMRSGRCFVSVFRTYKVPFVGLGNSGFGGLVVNMLASGTQDCGLKPGRSHRIFQAKKSSACLPSEGKKSHLSPVAALQQVKET
jgi:hypothetical protein